MSRGTEQDIERTEKVKSSSGSNSIVMGHSVDKDHKHHQQQQQSSSTPSSRGDSSTAEPIGSCGDQSTRARAINESISQERPPHSSYLDKLSPDDERGRNCEY